ncbi:uncharacterized protein Z518_02613 [Rhinocladiella mackenziei CBS 650.93]|uniref:Voltage-gated hydrogen channel 1 n=1 Tax=Rhinocladiella mackenziei CBS 650.93 TaxID=1442369 RepID=A0A0D2IQ02_9EURO|nr:uncharacterized protein Z518_02613 [Rhinocladiella mackenziei CBS 650.93]KIX07959.1 hypothetical protein Z518_02613 [Rhinocladiella mackenziei CBS 650.93]
MTDGDPETQPSQSNDNEHTPFLSSDRRYLSSLRNSYDLIGTYILQIHGEDSFVWRLRHQLQRFLSSKWGHYFVILLVSADISCIFADFLISLHICDHSSDKDFNRRAWQKADDVLDYVSLAFSCVFMLELLSSVFAFGFNYFQSKFHIFDALVIVAAFIVDVLLRGPIEEAGSLVVVGRLWRVFKIMEEFSSGAEDELAEMQTRIDELQRQKDRVVKQNQELRLRLQYVHSNQDGNEAAGG